MQTHGIRRTRSIGTKVTEDEYALVRRACAGTNLSDWVRATLLAVVRTQPAQRVFLAELLAMRSIVVTLHFATAMGEELTPEAVQRVIDGADRDKFQKADDRLLSITKRRSHD